MGKGDIQKSKRKKKHTKHPLGKIRNLDLNQRKLEKLVSKEMGTL